MNKLRHILASRIEANGGYSSGYHDRFAIEYNVALYDANLDKGGIYELACKEHGYVPPPTGLEWDEQKQWEWGQESLCSSLNDDDGQRSYSPATAVKYGLPMYRFPRKYKRRGAEGAYYPATKPGWVLDDPFTCVYFDVKFGLYGRGGKHLCVEEFEGHKLNVYSGDLAAMISDKEEDHGYSNIWCRNLLAMMEEWEGMFTSKHASRALEYEAAFRMHEEQSERAEAWRNALVKARAVHRGCKFLEAAQHEWVNPQLPGISTTLEERA